MARAFHLKRRGGTYHWRLRIPVDLVPTLGRREISLTLRSTDYRTAKTISASATARAGSVFGRLRARVVDPAVALVELTSPFDSRHDSPAALLRPADQSACGQPSISDPGISMLASARVEYCAEFRSVWAPKTYVMNDAALRLFERWAGNHPLGHYTRKLLGDYKQVLMRLPPNFTKRFPAEKIEDIIARGLKPISGKTVNKNLSSLSSFFRWAEKNGRSKTNPAAGLALPTKGRPDDERHAFTANQTQTLFTSPLFTGHNGSSVRSVPGTQIVADEKYWLPLIALHSGLRLEEIAQMALGDLALDCGIWCFHIHDGGDNRVKTPASVRLVPIHSTLRKNGLLAHRDSMNGEGRLWPNLSRGSDGTFGGAYSKWFGRYLDKIGLTDRKLSFHSLRHNFINSRKQKKQPREVIDALVGHAEQSLSLGRYGKRYETPVLAEVVESVQVPLPWMMPNIPAS